MPSPAGNYTDALGHGVQPVIIVGTADGSGAVSLGYASNVEGQVDHDAPIAGVGTPQPILVGGYASAAAPVAVSADGDLVRAWHQANGAQVVGLVSGSTLIGVGSGVGATALRVAHATDVSVGVIGNTAHDAPGAAVNPVPQAGYASAAPPADVSADLDIVRSWYLRNGATVVSEFGGAALADDPYVGNPLFRGSNSEPTEMSANNDATHPWFDRRGSFIARGSYKFLNVTVPTGANGDSPSFDKRGLPRIALTFPSDWVTSNVRFMVSNDNVTFNLLLNDARTIMEIVGVVASDHISGSAIMDKLEPWPYFKIRSVTSQTANKTVGISASAG